MQELTNNHNKHIEILNVYTLTSSITNQVDIKTTNSLSVNPQLVYYVIITEETQTRLSTICMLIKYCYLNIWGFRPAFNSILFTY